MIMEDLHIVAMFRAELASADTQAPASARVRLVEAIAAGERQAHPINRGRGLARWWLWAPAAGLATMVLVAFTGLGAGMFRSPRPATQRPALVFELAAAQVRQGSSPSPAPNQFIYVESVVEYQSSESIVVTQLRRLWLSPDGGSGWLDAVSDRSITGVSRTIPPDFHGPVTWQCAEQVGDCSDRLDNATLPTDKETMLKYLANRSGERADRPGQRTFDEVGELLRDGYLPPLTRAALFEAAAAVPGSMVMPDAVDAVGRHGVGVAMVTGGYGSELIFDKKTYAYLGERDLGSAAGGSPSTGSSGTTPPPRLMLTASAQTRTTVVKGLRELP